MKTKKILAFLLALLMIVFAGCSSNNSSKVEQLEEEIKNIDKKIVNLEDKLDKLERDAVQKIDEENKTINDNLSDKGEDSKSKDNEAKISKDQWYYELEDVVEYIHLYGQLPTNYISKDEAKKIGWDVDNTSGYVIGGDIFSDREGSLPKAKGRKYFEADIEAGYGKNRGPLRLVFSNDGLIFYTEDHYNSFEQIY